ncbi:hypothetical protein [Streptomyces sp. 8N706]|uniref:hypothetical protein n=1 Tax=Streptomyces sp. 8N706 TaxID=3457416 RepID=UPI003FD633AE
MKALAAAHEAMGPHVDAEQSLGIDFELFAGLPGESYPDKRARLAVAREVLADLRDAAQSDEVAASAARLAAALLRGTRPRRIKAVA